MATTPTPPPLTTRRASIATLTRSSAPCARADAAEDVTIISTVNFGDVLPLEPQLAAGAHAMATGYSNCEWLRHCDLVAGESVGSSCSIQRHGLTLRGYCYEAGIAPGHSVGGSLECGRTVRVDRGEPEDLTSTQTTDVPHRCPRGTPLTSLGTARVQRLLVGGCLLSSDASYDALAEVHVPQACALPLDHPRKGCLLMSASNYDPSALQSAPCAYRSRGCTSPTALNYRSAAAIDDGSCIEPTYGCTLPAESFANVDPSTPGFQESEVGVRFQGWVAYTQGLAVLNANASANTLGVVGQGRQPGHSVCHLAIEGCMDPSASNYDSLATVNSFTWCVPAILGCMMPLHETVVASVAPDASGIYVDEPAASGLSDPQPPPPAISGPTGPLPPSFLWLQAGAINFDANATVHDARLCIASRLGCTSSTAVNYDPLANLDDGRCFEVTAGCFNRTALNFNCTSLGPEAVCTADHPRATYHNAELCRFPWFEEPIEEKWRSFDNARPASLGSTTLLDEPLPNCSSCAVFTSVEVGLWVQGEPSDVNVSSLTAAFADAAGRHASEMPVVHLTPGSVQILVSIRTFSAASALALENALRPHLLNRTLASAWLDLEVISTPVIASVRTQMPVPPAALLTPAFASTWYGSLTIVFGAFLIIGSTVFCGVWRGARREGQEIGEYAMELSDSVRENAKEVYKSLRARGFASPSRVLAIAANRKGATVGEETTAPPSVVAPPEEGTGSFADMSTALVVVDNGPQPAASAPAEPSVEEIMSPGAGVGVRGRVEAAVASPVRASGE